MHTHIRHNWLGMILAAVFALTAQVQAEEKHGKFFGAKETEYPTWFKDSFMDFREDVAEAAKANKRLMIIFTQNGCPYCNALVERNLAQKDIEQSMRKHLDVVAINMWGDREVHGLDGKKTTEKEFALANKVQFTPTILFYNEQGAMILRLNGYLPPPRFKVALEFVISKQEKKQSYRDYVAAKVPAGKGGGEMRKEDFFAVPPYDLSRHKGKKPFAFFFEQKECPNCDVLHDKVLVDGDTRKIIAQFENIQLDMWSDTPLIMMDGKPTTARQLAKQLDVKYAPTLVVFNEQGQEVIRSEAFFKVFHTQGIFAYVIEGGYKTQPSFQRWLAARAEHIREQGKDVDIWRQGDEDIGERK